MGGKNRVHRHRLQTDSEKRIDLLKIGHSYATVDVIPVLSSFVLNHAAEGRRAPPPRLGEEGRAEVVGEVERKRGWRRLG